MKKSLIIISLIAIILSTAITSVFATSNLISLEGTTEVKPGATGTIKVKISSDEEIGVVSGKIEHSANITAIEVTGKNNWNLTYNKDEGIFNIYKAEGAKTEEFMEIKYTTGSEQGTGTITLSDIIVANLNYEEKSVDSIKKQITIKNSTTSDTDNDNSDEDSKDDSIVDDNTDEDSKDDPIVDDNTNEDSKDDPIVDDNTNEDSKDDTIVDDNTAGDNNNKNTTISGKTTLPKTGITKVILPISVIFAVGIVVVAYVTYRKYRGIK